jgi:hypothetical protein
LENRAERQEHRLSKQSAPAAAPIVSHAIVD